MRDAYLAPGSSPTTLHLLGAGKVGQAFLRLPELSSYSVVAVSDRKGTVFQKAGLDSSRIAQRKAETGSLAGEENYESLPLETAIEVIDADCMVDCTTTDLLKPQRALERSLAILASGRRLVLAAKDALLADTDALLAPLHRDRLGIHALLGGTGRALLSELDELREDCEAIVCVPNACTGFLIEAVEGGHDFEEGLERARDFGVLESDPEQDLRGDDAALKLVIVARAVFGRSLSLEEIERPDVRSLDASRLRAAREEGFTTRLVGRVARSGAASLCFERVPLTSSLAIPPTRVAYGYELASGDLRLHVGKGVGPEGTARAAFEDVVALEKGKAL